jgi:hypothetical protein
MEANLSILTHKIAIQLHLVAESCIICSSRSRRPVRKLLDTPSYRHAVNTKGVGMGANIASVVGTTARRSVTYCSCVKMLHGKTSQRKFVITS